MSTDEGSSGCASETRRRRRRQPPAIDFDPRDESALHYCPRRWGMRARSVGSAARRAVAVGLGLVACAPSPAAAAGCDAARPAQSYAPGAARATTPDSGAVLVPCRYDTGGRSLEPSLDFTRDGRILFQAWQLQPGHPNGAPLTPNFFRSDASYTRWRDVSPAIGPVQSLDPFLVVDHRTGRIFSVNFLADGVPNCSTVSTSDDDGDTWAFSPVACFGADGESLGVGPPATSTPSGYPDIAYYCTGTTPASEPPATSPICSKSLDGGRTFVPTGALPWPAADPEAQGDEFGPWAGNPIVGPDGTLYVPKRYAGQPEVAISHDEGSSWHREKVAGNGSAGETPRMAVDDAGHLFYAWTGGGHHAFLASSRDRGQTWSRPIDLTPPGVRDTALPRPAARGDGHVFVAFLASTDAPGRPPFSAYCNILLTPCDDGDYAKVTWNGYMTSVDDVFSGRPVLHTATIDPPSRPLLIGSCSADGGCKAELDFIDAKYSPQGDPFAAFVDDCRLQRDFIPVFGQDMGACGDNLGEGVVGRLTRTDLRAACGSRRAFAVRVRRPLRRAARSFELIVGGRTVARDLSPRRRARVDLRRRGRGEVAVVLRVRLRDGRVVRDTRRYHPCVVHQP